MTAQVILASASPRRLKLLKQIGIEAVVYPMNIDETPRIAEAPEAYVQRIAAEKSRLCVLSIHSDLPKLAADTVVVVEGRILGKPKNKEDAFAMLSSLSGCTHQVYSAVSLRGRKHGQALNITEVTFRPLTETEIRQYLQTGEPADKAGGYAIQGFASGFIENIKGSYSGVMGLPLFETANLLNGEGINYLL
jgi:septum formation protein